MQAWILKYGVRKLFNGDGPSSGSGSDSGRAYGGNYDVHEAVEIKLLLDMDAGTLSYVRNGVNLGVAFDTLQGKRLRLAVSTNQNVQLELVQYEPSGPPMRRPSFELSLTAATPAMDCEDDELAGQSSSEDAAPAAARATPLAFGGTPAPAATGPFGAASAAALGGDAKATSWSSSIPSGPGPWLVGAYYFKNSSPQFSFHFVDESMARSQQQFAADQELDFASVDVTHRGDSNLNVLEWAVEHGHWPVVKQALKGKFTWDQVGNVFKSKIDEIARVGPELLNAPDASITRQTLLMWAARTGDSFSSLGLSSSLVAANANLDQKDAEGRSALGHAIAGGNMRLVKLLIEKGRTYGRRENPRVGAA